MSAPIVSAPPATTIPVGLPTGARMLPPKGAAAPADASATTTPDASPPKPAAKPTGSRSELKAYLNRRIAEQNKRNARGAEPEEEAETEGEPAAAAEGDPTTPGTAAEAQAVEESGGAEAKPGETPKNHAARLATAMLKAQRMESELLTHKQTSQTNLTRAEKAEARAKELETFLEQLASDPVKALRHAKSNPLKIAEMMRDGVISAEQEAPEVQLPKAVQERLEKAERLAAEAEAREAKQAEEKAKEDARSAAEQQWKDELKLVDSVVTSPEFEAAYPMLAKLPGSSAQLLRMIKNVIAETGEEPSVDAVASALQAEVLKDSVSLYASSESAVRTLLSDEKVAAVFRKVLGTSKPPATAKPATGPSERTEEGEETAEKRPRTITNTATSRVPTRAKQVLKTSDLTAKINAQLFGK